MLATTTNVRCPGLNKIDQRRLEYILIKRIFHITTQSMSNSISSTGIYEPANYELDGFIHCSYVHQLISVLNRFYADANDLVLLAVDTDALQCPVIEENLEGGTELFPHIYGLIPDEAILKCYALTRDVAGRWVLPDQLV